MQQQSPATLIGFDLLAARKQSSSFLKRSFILGRKGKQLFFIPSELKYTQRNHFFKVGLGKLLIKKKKKDQTLSLQKRCMYRFVQINHSKIPKGLMASVDHRGICAFLPNG